MNKTLLKVGIKTNWVLLTIFNLVLLMYSSIMIYMFNPESTDSLKQMMEMLPKSFASAFGFNMLVSNLTTHIGSYLYGFIFIVFPFVFTTIMINGLVAKHVDRGSMAYLLATPNSRIEIITTQAVFSVMAIASLFITQTLLGILISGAMFPGLLDVFGYIKINLLTMFVFFVIGGIQFLASCIFNESRFAVGVGTAIPIAFILFKMIVGVSDKISVIKYFTILTLIDINKILSDNFYTGITILMLAFSAVVLYSLSIYIFNKRSLSI